VIHLEALSGPDLALTPAPLPLAAEAPLCTLHLRALPGASAIHLVAREDGAVRLRAEVPARAGEAVAVHLELGTEGTVHAWSPEVSVVTLPPEERWAPPTPIRPAREGAGLDVAVLVDGTLRAYTTTEGKPRVVLPLLKEKPLWKLHVEPLATFVLALLEGGDDRVAVLAFGDEATPKVTANALAPSYVVHPDEPGFGSPAPQRLAADLLGLPHSAGGDFVDALADGLAACRRLPWRSEARKVLVLTGSSPGASLLHPVPKGGDAQARERDVDCEILALHARGVEVVTLFHEPPADSGVGEFKHQLELLAHARTQYRRLASLPEWAWTTAGFDPQEAAVCLRGAPKALGRDATWGELLAVTTPDPENGSRPASP
jgi:hypothetical protein